MRNGNEEMRNGNEIEPGKARAREAKKLVPSILVHVVKNYHGADRLDCQY